MTKRTSDSYVFTADINSAYDMEQIAVLRKAVKIMNKAAKARGETPKRVELRGRKPAKKAEVRNFWTGKTSARSYDFGGNIVGGIANATKIDVYIYDRRS